MRIAFACALLLATAPPAHAQFGLVESLFDRVTDISFYASRGELAPRAETVRAADGLRGFGVELLFQVGAVTRRPEAAPPADSAALAWRERTITRNGTTTDTVDRYEVNEPEDEALEEVWTFELAIGYGQLTGFQSAEPELDLRGSVRELPAVTIYGSHAASALYFGLRTGLIETHALRLYDGDGNVAQGSGQAFQLGAALGWAPELLNVFPFLEAAWTARSFPSIEWEGDVIPPGAPRDLRLSGWALSAGLQVPLN
jgi:hypothetical protein